MITTNAAWDAKNALAAKTPIYAMAIGGQTTVYVTHDLAAMGITGTLPAFQPWLMVPQGASQTIDPVNGTSTIGELQCDVADKGGAITALVGGATLDGQTLTLSVGYPGIAWTEFVVLHTYQIRKIVPATGYGRYTFVAGDFQLLAKKTLSRHPENGDLLTADNPWYLSGSAAEIVQALVLFGLGLSVGTLDVAGIQGLDAPVDGTCWRPYLFALTEPFGVKAFLEQELFKPSGLYLVIGADGKMGLKSFRPPGAGVAPAFAFNQDNVTVLPQIDRLPVINEVIFRYDTDGSGFQTEAYFFEATSLSTFGRGQQWVVESKGLRSEWGAYAFAQAVSSRIFRRLAGTPAGLRGGAPTAKVEAFLMTLPVWPGDFVTLSHPKMPDLLTGAMGVTDRVYEVIEREPNYREGKMGYTLLDTGLTGLAAGRTWGAASARPLVFGTNKWY